MELQDKNLQKAIQYKVGKFMGEQLDKEDFAKVKDLSLSEFNLARKKVKYRFERDREINKFRNIVFARI